MLKAIIGKFGIYLVIGFLCVVLWNSNQRAAKYSKQANILETTIIDLNQEIKHTQICLNDSVKLYQAEVRNLNVTKENLEAKYNKLLNASKVKAKDVNSVTEIATVTASIDTVSAVKDSFGGIRAELKDPFVRIDVEVLPDLNAIIDYEVRDSLTVIDVQKKHSWLFVLIKWKEHKSVRVINHNPKAQIVSLQTIDVIE
ncbi:MAG: hypothetical protein NC453_29225 [Muribaculum sp.]|nr:hypothetical protein [Muribaculum sp.]